MTLPSRGTAPLGAVPLLAAWIGPRSEPARGAQDHAAWILGAALTEAGAPAFLERADAETLLRRTHLESSYRLLRG